VRWGAAGLAWTVLLLLANPLAAQSQPPSEKLLISAKSAFTWSTAGTSVVQLEGPVTITLDRATLTAQNAVVWLTPTEDGAPGEQHAEFALLGDATIKQEIGTRTGGRLFVTAQVQADPRIDAAERVARDVSDTPLYRQAQALRTQATAAIPISTTPAATQAARAASRPAAKAPARQAAPPVPVHFEAGQTDVVDTEEGTIAIVAWNGVKIFAHQPSGEVIELQAQRAVMYTALESLHDVQKQQKSARAREQVTGVYLEGDARIEYDSNKPGTDEQRLMGNRIYYEIGTDRAILVNAVLHTIDVKQGMPFIVRGAILRQLSKGEYDADHVEITSSAFAVPSYSLAADRLYIRQEPTGDPLYPQRINFVAEDATFRAFDVPFFYLPRASGSIGDRPGALRGLGVSDRTDQGYSFLSQWGLFETLGMVPPHDIDATYRFDYYQDRGPGFGLNAAYGGGFVTEPAHQPWNFLGDLRSYFIYDKGTDENFGRLPVKPDGEGSVLRGRVVFEHQHFFPDDWQAQVRLGYVSDPTFLEEWFPEQFYEQLPTDESAYIKRQRDTEAFTLLVEGQPSRLVTTSDRMAEQFEVERLPEIGYHRIGDDLGAHTLTLFSDNTADGLQFQPTRATLREQGFSLPTINPGIPALGTTGVPTSTTWRGDTREEIALPISAGHFKLVPYAVGRFTEYSDSPSGSDQSRVFGALGARMTTSFWKIDPTAESDLFDIHQLRHVIEPELNLFTSGTNVDRNHLFQYDIPVDSINDTSAVEMGLRQRWQTERGGPGRWRSVDAFTLDLDAQFFANKPSRSVLNPYDFRGNYFSSLPEASIPRDSANADASWRITDNTVVLADAQYNIDETKLATAAVGILVRRDAIQSYYFGNRYIADLNSNITTVQGSYQISPKYTITFSQSFDFGLGKDVNESFSLVRNFDRFVMVVSASHDQIGNQTGFSFNVYPMGFGQGLNSAAIQGPFHR
jgi:hypothetical protein